MCSCCREQLDLDRLVPASEAGKLPLHLRLAATSPDAPLEARLDQLKAEGPPDVLVHHARRSWAAGNGRIGCRTWTEPCGPVEPVEVDPYVDQIEAFIGERVW